jgi:two-component system, OmpR family, response regulator
MLPRTLALIDDDAEFGTYLTSHLRQLGLAVREYDNPAAFLADPDAYRYDFYVVDLGLPAVDGVELIKILRLRTNAGVLVVSGRSAPDVFASVVKAGADMYLSKPVQFEQVALAIEAVHRRSARSGLADAPWRLDGRTRELIAPDGMRVALSETDLSVMRCFVQAAGEPVTRETLSAQLGYALEDSATGALNAAIFRLRRRIERATALPVPLQAKSRLGYQFRAPLSWV